LFRQGHLTGCSHRAHFTHGLANEVAEQLILTHPKPPETREFEHGEEGRDERPERGAFDSTGAGDAFCGTLAAALANGIGMHDAVLRATAAGALATTVHGAVPSLPTAVQVDELLAR
jgi:sugar/nucleoside kinase (ribokinase family)